jgi:hypothetical protein
MKTQTTLPPGATLIIRMQIPHIDRHGPLSKLIEQLRAYAPGGMRIEAVLPSGEIVGWELPDAEDPGA